MNKLVKLTKSEYLFLGILGFNTIVFAIIADSMVSSYMKSQSRLAGDPVAQTAGVFLPTVPALTLIPPAIALLAMAISFFNRTRIGWYIGTGVLFLPALIGILCLIFTTPASIYVNSIFFEYIPYTLFGLVLFLPPVLARYQIAQWPVSRSALMICVLAAITFGYTQLVQPIIFASQMDFEKNLQKYHELKAGHKN